MSRRPPIGARRPATTGRANGLYGVGTAAGRRDDPDLPTAGPVRVAPRRIERPAAGPGNTRTASSSTSTSAPASCVRSWCIAVDGPLAHADRYTDRGGRRASDPVSSPCGWIGMRQPRSENSWMHNLPMLMGLVLGAARRARLSTTPAVEAADGDRVRIHGRPTGDRDILVTVTGTSFRGWLDSGPAAGQPGWRGEREPLIKPAHPPTSSHLAGMSLADRYSGGRAVCLDALAGWRSNCTTNRYSIDRRKWPNGAGAVTTSKWRVEQDQRGELLMLLDRQREPRSVAKVRRRCRSGRPDRPAAGAAARQHRRVRRGDELRLRHPVRSASLFTEVIGVIPVIAATPEAMWRNG